jgi:ABC-type glycerol-3-phosphate transport system substrate-binding protein
MPPDESTLYFEGFMIRNDWLKKLGLAAPTTVDVLYRVLVAFKR